MEQQEAAEYYAHNYFDMHETNNYKALKEGFIAGAKWQQERSYSEEDMRKAFEWGLAHFTFEEWIKQFKNK